MCLRGGNCTDFIIYKDEMKNYSTTRHQQQQDITDQLLLQDKDEQQTP